MPTLDIPDILEAAKQAPPPSGPANAKVAYDRLFPAVRLLVQEKGYTMKQAVDWLVQEKHWAGTAKEKSSLYRSLCRRMSAHEEREQSRSRAVVS